MIKTDIKNDAGAGIKGFTSAFNLLEMGAKRANDFLKWIVADPTIQVHVGVEDLGEKAASTDYMIKGTNAWVLTATGLRAAYGVLDGPVSQVGSSIRLNNRTGAFTQGYLEVARVLAHELTLHAMAIETFRERLLARDEELQNEWRDLVSPGGQLSEQNQHAAAAFGTHTDYEPLIAAMCDVLTENQYAAHAKTLRGYYEDDILHLKVEVAKRELGNNYLQHHLLAGVQF